MEQSDTNPRRLGDARVVAFIPQDVSDRIDAAAAREGLSRSAWLRTKVLAVLRDCEPRSAA